MKKLIMIAIFFLPCWSQLAAGGGSGIGISLNPARTICTNATCILEKNTSEELIDTGSDDGLLMARLFINS